MTDTTSNTYYCLWYRLDGTDGYLIWYSNNHDGVVVQLGGTVPSFRSPALLHDYAAAHQIVIAEEEPMLHDLDCIEAWLCTPTISSVIDCDAFLAAWNLFGDISVSVNGNFDRDHKKTQNIYDKLFWGNNLPAITPPGKHYTPIWSDEELQVLREVLANGLQLFRQVIRQV